MHNLRRGDRMLLVPFHICRRKRGYHGYRRCPIEKRDYSYLDYATLAAAVSDADFAQAVREQQAEQQESGLASMLRFAQRLERKE